MRSDVHRLPARQARGFTLLELMVTVVLVSILATVAVASYTKWSMRARSEEAVMFLTDLKQQQETYFTTYRQYVGTGGFFPGMLPHPDGGAPIAWNIECPGKTDQVRAWCALGAARPTSLGMCLAGTKSTTGRGSYHQFRVEGWSPGAAPPDPSFIQNPNRQWWFAIAQGDLDFDGTLSEWFISSETREAYNRQGNNL